MITAKKEGGGIVYLAAQHVCDITVLDGVTVVHLTDGTSYRVNNRAQTIARQVREALGQTKRFSTDREEQEDGQDEGE